MISDQIQSQYAVGQNVQRAWLGKSQATPVVDKVENESRRTRKSHKKVRTGCQTCKIRHKKCDETRPTCKRCTTTGRHCDGYGVNIDQANTTVSAQHPEAVTTVAVAIDEASPTVPAYHVRSYNDPRENAQHGLLVDPLLEPLLDSSKSATEHSTPISEVFDDAEIEAFICDFVPTETVPSTNICLAEGLQVGYHPSCVPRAPNMFPSATKLSDLEVHCFSQFRFRTGPQFASYFDSTFWRQYCTSFALCHPVLFAAAAALGAVHRRYGYGISREAFEYCAHASRLKMKAQRGLDRLKAEQKDSLLAKANTFNVGISVSDRDVIMASEMLLGLFEGFQSDFDMALSHMKTGLTYMLDRPMSLIYSETAFGPTESTLSGFVAFVGRIKDCAATLFDSPVRILAARHSGESMPPVPDIFENLDQARDYIFTEAEWILTTPLSTWKSDAEREAAQNLHVSRILRWNVAYADTIVHMERTTRQKRACMLCKLLRTALYFLLYLAAHVSKDIELDIDHQVTMPQQVLQTMPTHLAFAQAALWNAVASRDEILSNLARIQILGDSIIDDQHIFHYVEHSVDFDSAMGPPKAGKQLVESSGKIKHLVRILSGKPIDDVLLWETLGVYGVAERISAIEEHAVIEAVRLLIPPNTNPKWVDVACIMEERKILLRYCHQESTGTIWTQQWWKF